MKSFVGKHDILMLTLDTLRYDVAQSAWKAGELKGLEAFLGPQGWEKRHSPASFTYAAHHAFFAGFLPTPVGQGPHPRLFAANFAGATSIDEDTFTFEEATLPEALADRGYRTVCIGGTGFFNQKNELSHVLPDLFQESHWERKLGVTDPRSEINQVELAISHLDSEKPLFIFLNVAAIHQPNWFYSPQSLGPDTLESHKQALLAVDRALIPLWDACRARGPAFVMVFSDHGTAYGEDGYTGHRIGHQIVWDVPYAEFEISSTQD